MDHKLSLFIKVHFSMNLWESETRIPKLIIGFSMKSKASRLLTTWRR